MLTDEEFTDVFLPSVFNEAWSFRALVDQLAIAIEDGGWVVQALLLLFRISSYVQQCGYLGETGAPRMV